MVRSPTSFSGFDSFSYKLNDGSADSNIVTVSIAVDGDFGARTNQEEAPRESFHLSGGLELTESITPGLALVYQSNTIPQPIVAIETSLLSGSTVPDDIDAQLTFNGTAGSTYTYDTANLSAGESFRIALQANATSLATGHYDYSVELTANSTGGSTSRTFSGSQDVVNRNSSAHPFGRGWQLTGLDGLVVDSSGALWVQSDGIALWFPSDGAGGFLSATGDESFSSLVENGNGTFTLTAKSGTELNFNASGVQTSQVDRNGNTIAYTYTSGLLTKVTDPFSRETNLSYTSGRLTSVTDFAGRSATLVYDGSGRLTSITQPDPDGTGSQSAPVTSFAYDATSHRLTTRTDALNQDTDYTYGSHGRLTKITHPDANDVELISLQTIGLPTSSTGNTLAPASPEGVLTDERNHDSTFKTDRFGHLTRWSDQLNHVTLTERNHVGQVIRTTGADPDGTGPLSSPVTVYGYSAAGNLTFLKNPDNTTQSWTYTTAFHQVASATDELNRTHTFVYDTDGNLTTATDPAGFQTTNSYNSLGFITSTTAPDPTGPVRSVHR
jgi:YD repeat-containing protein